MNMKKLFTLFLATIVLSSAMMLRAEVISSEVAKQTADNYLMLDDEWRGAVDATVQLIEHEGVAAYYVVEYNGGGWVIVSAQSSSDPVIGYNTSDKFVAPEPMQAVLDACAENIVRISQTEGIITVLFYWITI